VPTAYFPSDVIGLPTGAGNDPPALMAIGLFPRASGADVATAGMRIYADSSLVGVKVRARAFNAAGADLMITPPDWTFLSLGWNDLPFPATITVTSAARKYLAVEQDGSSKYLLTANALPGASSPVAADGLILDDAAGGSVFAYKTAEAGASDWADGTTGHSHHSFGIDIIVQAGGLSAVANHSPASPAVGTPTTLTATPAGSTGTVTYAWSKTSGPAATLSGASTASASFTPAAAGTYVFQCVVNDAAGIPVTVSTTVVVTAAPDTTAPSVPGTPTQTAITDTTVSVSWPASTDDVAVTAYRVYRGGVLQATVAGTSATLTGLSPLTNYAITVAAGDAAGNWSAQSSALSVTTLATPGTLPKGIGFIRPDGHGWYELVSGASLAPADPAWVFRPKNYGLGDSGVADDAAIAACVAAASAAAAPGNGYYVEVVIDPEEYVASTPAVLGGAQHGRAMIPVPYVPASTSSKVTLVLNGTGYASLLHWAQKSRQMTGTTIRSTWTGGAWDPTYGVPSVIGGPTNLSSVTQDEFATFSNMLVVVKGIGVVVPHNSPLGGFDFRLVGAADVLDASVFSDRFRTTDGSPSIMSVPTNPDGFGLVMPKKGNNAQARIGKFNAEGVYAAVVGGEHLNAEEIKVLYAKSGLYIEGYGGGTWPDGTYKVGTHGYRVGMLLCEAVDRWVDNSGDAAVNIVIDALNGEGPPADAHIYDPNSMLTGSAQLLDIFSRAEVVGAERMRLVDGNSERGARTLSMPASGVEGINPFYRDATVYLSGGTVTDVAIGQPGATVSIGARTSFHLPTGLAWKPTYTGSPTAVAVTE
jgi:hypothetical protein